MENYKALVVRENSEGKFVKQIETVSREFLPENDILIKVAYAGLNYKDALSAKGNKGVTRKYPHTPGVDASGIIEESNTDDLPVGMKVIVTSYDLGMNTKGGFAEYISVPAEWVVPLPESMSLKDAMVMGTAAYTAALALHKMELCGQHPDMGEIVVTGASGGVGSMAIAILRKAGYRIIASSGKQEHYTWLRQLGAKKCINRDEVSDESGKPLLSPAWAGAIDTVGGNTLATLLKRCGRNGSVAACGLVSSSELHTTVFPFILNGVNLLGVDSAETPRNIRMKIWERLAGDLRPENLESMELIVPLEKIPSYMDEILEGETVGRVVADLSI
ncbi:YhdH/YhfP family quinone oxidoreductase [Cryomorpha ignava]|uniref:YhdH/YhfP family quinone oxidoreductase n=1 Tax=Cryomorpha ignava TaxID=101383 RepID=A0A7K3WSY4_9FLAO|nr:YhdH/YhfP family quinone oxidoreductase [Cryomorpha ignava]NEN24803.1 YhdH/YhfP family quinone oxidoreductase [Cryomorpha ignava]